MILPLYGAIGPLGARRRAAAAVLPPLDGVANVQGAYSLRRLRTAYTGPLVRLRRSTDNAESNFGYVSGTGLLDTAAIAAWLGAATGYATTWYDQGGGGFNLTQTTAANQPTYDNTGAFPKLNVELAPVGMVSELDILRPFTIYMVAVTTMLETVRNLQSRDVNAVFSNNRADGNAAYCLAPISSYSATGTLASSITIAGGVSSYYVENVDRTTNAAVNHDWRRLAVGSSGTNAEAGRCSLAEIVVGSAGRNSTITAEQMTTYD